MDNFNQSHSEMIQQTNPQSINYCQKVHVDKIEPIQLSQPSQQMKKKKTFKVDVQIKKNACNNEEEPI